MREVLWSLARERRRFLIYCCIGGAGVTVDFAVYSALVRWAGWSPQRANAISYASGTLLSFLLNSRYNFKATDRLPTRFFSFCAVALLGWAVSALLLHLLVDRLNMDKYLAKAATLAVVVLLQYNLNRLYSFRKIRQGADV